MRFNHTSKEWLVWNGQYWGTKLAQTALSTKKAGKYFGLVDKANNKILVDSTTKLAKLNAKGRTARFAAGAITGGAMEGVFIGDVEAAGTFGNLLGGPTRLHETIEGDNDPARALVNRVKFGTEGALFNLALAGIGTGVGKLHKPSGKYVRKVEGARGEKVGEILTERQVKDGSISSSALKNEFEFVETGVDEYGTGLRGLIQKYWLGLRKQGTGTLDSFQLKRAAIADTAVRDEAARNVSKRFTKDLKEAYAIVEKDWLKDSASLI